LFFGGHMPYKNIVFVKLEKRLFNDPRFYMLSEKAQLNYVKFMLFAAETYNRIPINLSAIRKGFKTNQSILAIENTISEIQKVFPKFKKNGEFYYFEDFETKTNYIRDCPSNAEGTPKEVTDIDKEKEEDIDKEEEEDISLVLNRWNVFADKYKLTKVVKLTDKRKSGIKNRLTDKDFNLDHLFIKIEESDFLLGKNKQGWQVSFDWIFCTKDNWIKIMEGNYGRNNTGVGASPEHLANLVKARYEREQKGG
jgi:hypothetical protein